MTRDRAMRRLSWLSLWGCLAGMALLAAGVALAVAALNSP